MFFTKQLFEEGENSLIEQNRRSPLKLVKNVRYPSYQLWATAANTKTPPQTSMVIAILTVMAWLRERFRAFDIPPELKHPDPSQYEGITLSTLKSMHINEGYTVDIVSISDEEIWALQLKEPDHGPDPGNPNQTRKPVPGRMFETNIAFRIYAGRLECGFQTMVAEPEDCTVICEVFRLAVIKLLVRNPLVGLSQIIQVQENSHELDTMSSIKSLKDCLKDDCCGLPAIVFSEYLPPKKKPVTPKTPKELLDELQGVQSFTAGNIDYIKEKFSVYPVELLKPLIPYDIKPLARSKMGYAQFFTLPYGRIEDFNRIFGSKISAGDVAIIEPKSFGGETSVWSLKDDEKDKESLLDKLDAIIQNYPMKKPAVFGNVMFSRQAKLLEREKMSNDIQSVEERLQNSVEREVLNKKSYQDRLDEAKQEIEFWKEKTDKAKTEITEKKNG